MSCRQRTTLNLRNRIRRILTYYWSQTSSISSRVAKRQLEIVWRKSFFLENLRWRLCCRWRRWISNLWRRPHVLTLKKTSSATGVMISFWTTSLQRIQNNQLNCTRHHHEKTWEYTESVPISWDTMKSTYEACCCALLGFNGIFCAAILCLKIMIQINRFPW